MEHATTKQRIEYRKRGDEIDEVKEDFYALEKQGIDYDCFICVKVTDDDSRTRTKDYDVANDIYYYLKDKGFKPFFSERVLRNLTGSAYEAQILYALYKSECMLVVCSNEDYLQTPWVKNEYTRFNTMIAGEDKESDAITIVFNGKPIERLPGREKKIQGIDFTRPDATERIVKFVDVHTPEAKQRKEEEARRKQEEAEAERRAREEEERRSEEQNRLIAEQIKQLQEQQRLLEEQRNSAQPVTPNFSQEDLREAMRKAVEANRLAQEEEARQAEEARRRAEEERKRKEEEERIAEEEERRRKEEEARKRREEEAKRRAEEAAKREKTEKSLSSFTGMWPQSRVEDESLCAILTERAGGAPKRKMFGDVEAGAWKKYQEHMFFIDVVYAGEKYRGIYLTKVFGQSNINNYSRYKCYWFKWEPIEWRVLEKNDGEALLMSNKIIDCKQYYHVHKGTRTIDGKTVYPNNYNESDIRKWINVVFYEEAFNSTNKTVIKSTLVDNSASTTRYSDNPYACENTNDKVFLLSYKEATNTSYGLTPDSRQLKPTDYAKSQGASVHNNGNGWWWLRSPDHEKASEALSVHEYISSEMGIEVDFKTGGIVPALRIALE